MNTGDNNDNIFGGIEESEEVSEKIETNSEVETQTHSGITEPSSESFDRDATTISESVDHEAATISERIDHNVTTISKSVDLEATTSSERIDHNVTTISETSKVENREAKTKKKVKPKKATKSLIIPTALLCVSLLAFLYFFLRVFPVRMDSQQKINNFSSSLTTTLKISVDPRTCYPTGIIGEDDFGQSTLLLYEMKDGYVLINVSEKTMRELGMGDVLDLNGKKMPPISAEGKAQIVAAVSGYDEISEEEAQKIVEKIPCVDLRFQSGMTGMMLALPTALIAGLSFFWLLQRRAYNLKISKSQRPRKPR